MTNEMNGSSPLQSWWDNLSFTGKNLYHLRENGELVLQAINNNKERVIANLSIENAEAILKAMTDKFPEVEVRFKELQAEWNTTEDKLKMVGKVERVREYLNHTNLVGDFEVLFQQISEWEKDLKKHEDENYQAKLLLIQKAEAAADNDKWKETTQLFRDLTEQWKHIGHVDKHRNDELWNRMEAARSKFYERKRQHQDDQGREMLQNLDLKMELVEKAEQLALSESWKDTTEIFKQLMDLWKTIGRTMPEKNEELWNRFIIAKNTFYDRKKVHFESIQNEQEANLIKKEAIIEKAETLKESTNWNDTTQVYAELMEEWKATGRVPHEKADELWGRFTSIKEYFFQRKRDHFETLRVVHDDNYAQKMSLLKRAEVLKHSTQWREATEEMNELMTEWKRIGAVPKEHSNRIWEEFCAARKHFFDRKDADRERRKQHTERQKEVRAQQTRNFHHKLIEEVTEEQEKLEDFKNALENVTSGPKEQELRQHLQKLIEQTEERLLHKKQKLEEVQKQQNELESKDPPTATEQ